MFVYGWNGRVIKEAPFKGQKCVSCQNETTHIVITSQYAHVFWIPMFPYKKKLSIVCTHCGYEAEPSEVSDEVRAMAKQLKSSVRTPWYLYFGLIAIVVLIGVFQIQGIFDGRKDKEMLENPQVNDVYHLFNPDEPTTYKYSFLKVTQVVGDSVHVAPNSFGYDGRVYQLDYQDGFYDIYYSYHKSELLNLFQEDKIIDISREYTNGTGFNRELVYTPDSQPNNNP